MVDITSSQQVDTPTKSEDGQFPSHFIDPEEKKTAKYALQYAKAFHSDAKNMPTEASLFRNNASYSRYRRYARGEQSQDQYKELLGLTKNQGKLNTSYRNLDFSIFKIAPKLKNVVVNTMTNQPLKLKVRPIDPVSINERRQEKNAMLEYVINQENINRFEMLSKLGLQRPTQPGVPPPSSVQEIDPYLDMHPKNMMAMEVKDYLTLNLAINDWNQTGLEVAGDFYDIGVAAVRTYIDSNGMIRFRRSMPERMVMNKCVRTDYSDVIRVAEYFEITVADLKQRTQGKLGEDTYKRVADQVAGKTRSAYTGAVDHYWSDSTYTYAYDREKVTVMDITWFSIDHETHVEEKNYYGNNRMRKKKFNYVPFKGDASVNGGKGLSDQEYNEKNNGSKTIYRKEIKNVYQCSWVVDTDIVFDYGLMTNMMKQSRSIAEAQLPWTIMTTDFMSTVGNIESPLDQFQLNWLQFQSHIAASKPPGVAIERKALSKLGTVGQGGEKWDPKQALVMYAETGSIVYDGYDNNGNPLPYMPIQPLANGLSPSAMEHFNIMIQMLDMMRTILGINGLVEGQQPAERLGAKVAQISMDASSNALGYLTTTYRRFYEKVCSQIMLLLPNAMEIGQAEDMSEALGTESIKFFNLNRDIGLKDMGITVEAGPDDEVKERISQACQIGIEKGWLMPEDAIAVELEDNYFRAILTLRKKRLEFQAQQTQQQQMLIQTQGQQTVEAAHAAADREDAQIQKKLAAEQQARMIEHQLAEDAAQRQFMRDVMLKKLDHNMELSDMEQAVIDDVIRIHAKGQIEIQKEVIKADAKKDAKKATVTE